MVFLHHAIAGWPSWPEYRRHSWGPVLYTPHKGLGKQRSKTVATDTKSLHEISVVDPTHPITDGLPHRFSMTDELYLYEVDEPNITPLLTSDFTFQQRTLLFCSSCC